MYIQTNIIKGYQQAQAFSISVTYTTEIALSLSYNLIMKAKN